MHVYRIHPALVLVFGLLAGCAKTGQMKTEFAPISVEERPLSALPPGTQAVLRINLKSLKTSSITRPLVEQLLSDEAMERVPEELRVHLKDADEIIVGLGHSTEQQDSEVLVMLQGAFADGKRLQLYGAQDTVARARARIEGSAAPSGLHEGQQHWRRELAFDRSAIAYVARPGRYAIEGQRWSVPEEWEKVAFALNFESGLSARFAVEAQSPELARRTLKNFERMRERAIGSLAVRILGLSDVLAALEFRNLAKTVTARLRLTEQEALAIVQRFQLMGGIKDLLGEVGPDAGADAER